MFAVVALAVVLRLAAAALVVPLVEHAIGVHIPYCTRTIIAIICTGDARPYAVVRQDLVVFYLVEQHVADLFTFLAVQFGIQTILCLQGGTYYDCQSK